MTRVIWAPQAIQDVDAIRAYVARDSVRYADLVVERLVAAVERLKDSPHSGRVVPELGDESIREVIVGNYRIVYRPDMMSLRLRPSSMGRACSDSTKCDDIPASNFSMNPLAASRCSAATGYRER